MISRIALRVLPLSLLGLSAPALAMTCEEIMSMVDVNVPASIVVQTMESSGSRFDGAALACLAKRGAPDEILAAARRMASSDPAPVSPTERSQPPAESPTERGFEEEEGLGSDLPSPTERPPAEAGEEEEEGAGPREVADLVELCKAKKLLTSTKGLYDILEDKQFPEEESRISYYLGKCLYDLQMYHGAQYYFLQVVRRGPSNSYFKYALPKMVAISEMTGDDTEILRFVAKIPPAQYPRQAKNHLYYLLGRHYFEQDQLAEASRAFEQIAQKSDLYLRAKYYEGVIATKREKQRSAVKAFRDVYTAVPEGNVSSDRQAQEIADIQDLALMDIARIYYAVPDFDNAEKYYSQIARDSSYWSSSLYELAWTHFQLARYNDSLGDLLTVNSPYYKDEVFIPEATILRALNFYTLCQVPEVDRTLKQFETEYKPMIPELQQFLEQYQTEEGLKLADQAYDAFFSAKHADSKLSKALFLRTLRNKDLSDLVRHLDMMDQEEAKIDEQKGAWKDTLGARLKEIIAEDRARYKRKAGLALIKELTVQLENLQSLSTQGELIRFETTNIRLREIEAEINDGTVNTLAAKGTDFATDRKRIYWPFNGEFWQDELGYYQYTEIDKCAK